VWMGRMPGGMDADLGLFQRTAFTLQHTFVYLSFVWIALLGNILRVCVVCAGSSTNQLYLPSVAIGWRSDTPLLSSVSLAATWLRGTLSHLDLTSGLSMCCRGHRELSGVLAICKVARLEPNGQTDGGRSGKIRTRREHCVMFLQVSEPPAASICPSAL
jgi:hypothetical protein